MNIELRFVHEDVDRHGNVRIYFRRRGFGKVRMREAFGSAEFVEHYERLKAQSEAGKAITGASRHNGRTKPGTWRDYCIKYFAASEFKRLQPDTQRVRRRILEATFLEPISPGSEHLFGDMPIEHFGAKAVKVLRDRKAATPEAANSRIKSISRVFAWAIEDEQPRVRHNPTREVARLKNGSTGWHTWSEAEVAQFEATHPVGSRERLALALLLLTGVRRSDVVRLGSPHLRGGRLVFTAWKNRNSKPVHMDIPVLPELQVVLDASQLGAATFLVSGHGRPFSSAGFGNWFRERCNEAGLSHCAAHGLRKAGSTRAAENGATAHQLMAMFGWSTLKQAEIYTKAAQRRQLAGDGMPLIVGRATRNGGAHSPGNL